MPCVLILICVIRVSFIRTVILLDLFLLGLYKIPNTTLESSMAVKCSNLNDLELAFREIYVMYYIERKRETGCWPMVALFNYLKVTYNYSRERGTGLIGGNIGNYSDTSLVLISK